MILHNFSKVLLPNLQAQILMSHLWTYWLRRNRRRSRMPRSTETSGTKSLSTRALQVKPMLKFKNMNSITDYSSMHLLMRLRVIFQVAPPIEWIWAKCLHQIEILSNLTLYLQTPRWLLLESSEWPTIVHLLKR